MRSLATPATPLLLAALRLAAASAGVLRREIYRYADSPARAPPPAAMLATNVVKAATAAACRLGKLQPRLSREACRCALAAARGASLPMVMSQLYEERSRQTFAALLVAAAEWLIGAAMEGAEPMVAASFAASAAHMAERLLRSNSEGHTLGMRLAAAAAFAACSRTWPQEAASPAAAAAAACTESERWRAPQMRLQLAVDLLKAAGSAQRSLGQQRQLAAVQPGRALCTDAPQQSVQEQACLLAHHAIVSLSATVLQLLSGTFGGGCGGASKVPTEAASRDGSSGGGGGSSELAAAAMARSGTLDALIEALRFDMSAAGSSPVQMTKSAAAACNALAAVAGSCDAAGLEALPAQLTDALARAAVAMVAAGCDALEAATQQLSRAARRQLAGSRELRIALTGESSQDDYRKYATNRTERHAVLSALSVARYPASFACCRQGFKV